MSHSTYLWIQERVDSTEFSVYLERNVQKVRVLLFDIVLDVFVEQALSHDIQLRFLKLYYTLI
jgi:hypothetical protein